MVGGGNMAGIGEGFCVLSDFREFIAKILWFFEPCLVVLCASVLY